MSDKQIKIVWVDIDELVPSEYNPRKATKKEWQDLENSISRFGIVEPLVVNSAPERKNIIIGGHFRYEVAKKLGIKKLPVVYVNIPDLNKEMELNLRLNKNTGHWDWDMLANFDEQLLYDVGFDEAYLVVPNIEIDVPFIPRFVIKIEFDNEADMNAFKKWAKLKKNSIKYSDLLALFGVKI